MGKSIFAHILSILHEPFYLLAFDNQKNFVELEVVQRRIKRSGQKYKMASYVGMANEDGQLEFGGWGGEVGCP